MGLGTQIHNLWNQFNKVAVGFHKGQALLDYMYANEEHSEGSKKKVRYSFHTGTDTRICDVCWRTCAGFAKPTGKRTSLFSDVSALFNAGVRSARTERDYEAPGKKDGKEKNELKVAVDAFLTTWLEHNSDMIPEDTAFNYCGPPRAHVDVARKRDIWVECCAHLQLHYGVKLARSERNRDEAESTPHPLVSEPWFLKILNNKVNVIIHKHKKFSQCVTCFLFKQLIAKVTNPADRAEVRAHRRQHYDTVYAERVIYHRTRNYAKENPEEALSMIVDAQTRWRTQGPTLPRQVGSGFPADFEAFGQQLYGCLVHALPGDDNHKGGFFGYMIDDSVKGGANVTCEIIYATLLKLQELRAIWPELFDIRLDNTTKDNKNLCVFAFLGWLVSTGVFKTVRLRYLSVGHTHEDIDALFGILMQHLYRSQCFETIEILMDAIYDSFFRRDAKHASGSQPSAKLRHMRATHDWTAWLTVACEEKDVEAMGMNDENPTENPHANCAETKPKRLPAVRKVEKYARRVPDSHRPHEFIFSKAMVNGSQCVVLNYKHWSRDEGYWNKEPIVLFNFTPDVHDLKPAPLNPKVIIPVATCVAAPSFLDHTKLCPSQRSGEVDANGEHLPSKLKNCPRCKVHVAFCGEHKSAAMFTTEHQDAWARRFAEMTEISAHATLTPVTVLRPYDRRDPLMPFVLPEVLQGPSAAYLSVEPVTFLGYTEAKYRKLLAAAEVGVVHNNASGAWDAVEQVIGVKCTRGGATEVAVIWATNNPQDGGTWQPLADLNSGFTRCDGDELEDNEDGQATGPEATERELSESVRMHNWDLYFGREVDEDLNIICGFAQGRDSSNYEGILVSGNYDEHTGQHHVHFPVAPANALFGTVHQDEVDEYVTLRLDNLDCFDKHGERDDAVNFWVKRDYVGLPFITKHLPSLKVDVQPPVPLKRKKSKKLSKTAIQATKARKLHSAAVQRSRKKRQLCSSDDEDEVVVPEPFNKTTIQQKVKNAKGTRKQTNKEKTKELMETMRKTPM